MRTGLLIDAYFSASKIRWLLDHVPGARARAEAGKLAFGTVDTWLVWKLTGGACHVTDVSNASRTMLFNIHTLQWDDELLRLFNIPASLLPTVRVLERSVRPGIDIARDRSGARGRHRRRPAGGALRADVPHAGHVEEHVRHRLLPAAEHRQLADSRRASSWSRPWRGRLADGRSTRSKAACSSAAPSCNGSATGSASCAPPPTSSRCAASVADNGGVYLVPAFAGLGAPHWDPYARGTIVGITRGTTAGHIARAALESIAYQVSDLLDAMAADAGIPLTELRVDGGAATNNTLMQFQADLLGVPVVRPVVTETTALGAAYLAGLAVGFWPSVDAISGQWKVDRRFEPAMPRSATGRCVSSGPKRCSAPRVGSGRRSEQTNAGSALAVPGRKRRPAEVGGFCQR